MIYLLIGENDYEISEFVGSLKSDFEGSIYFIDDNSRSIELSSILTGQSLFFEKKLIILKNISEHPAIWRELPRYLNRVDDNSTVLIIETKPDKRTTTFKEIAKIAQLKTFENYDYKTASGLRSWLIKFCSDRNIAIDNKLANILIDRAGYNQWSLVNAIDKLDLLGDVSESSIIDQVDAAASDNIFQLLELSLNKRLVDLRNAIDSLKAYEDPYKTLGLISSQTLIIMAIMNSDKSDNIAKDFGVNPYMLSKLKSVAAKLNSSRLRIVIRSLVWADEKMKSSSEDPWTYLDQALMKIASSK